MKTGEKHERIQAFVIELTGFAAIAEETLEQIESDKDRNKGLFSIFSEKMFAIRGTADQLGLPHISNIARLGEEIAHKGSGATSRPQVRRCVGSLWDALSTVKHLLKNYQLETGEEQKILTASYRDTLAKAVAEAILTYKRSVEIP